MICRPFYVDNGVEFRGRIYREREGMGNTQQGGFDSENDKPYQPEFVSDPTDCYEWLECVATEVIWQTCRTINWNELSIRNAIVSLFNSGANPSEAAKYLIDALQFARVPSGMDAV